MGEEVRGKRDGRERGNLLELVAKGRSLPSRTRPYSVVMTCDATHRETREAETRRDWYGLVDFRRAKSLESLDEICEASERAGILGVSSSVLSRQHRPSPSTKWYGSESSVLSISHATRAPSTDLCDPRRHLPAFFNTRQKSTSCTPTLGHSLLHRGPTVDRSNGLCLTATREPGRRGGKVELWRAREQTGRDIEPTERRGNRRGV